MRSILIYVFLASVIFSCHTEVENELYRQLSKNRVGLPNGWALTPAGQHLQLGDLPLNMVLNAAGDRAIVSNNGQSGHSLQWIDLQKNQVLHTLNVPKLWYGLALNEAGNTLYAAAGNDNCIRRYEIEKDQLKYLDSISLGKAFPQNKIWPAGLALDEKRQQLYVACKDSTALFILDLQGKKVKKTIPLGAQAYASVLAKNGNQLYVSLWGAAEVLLIDLTAEKIQLRIKVGLHPTEIVESTDGKRLFVACADDNSVAVIDLAQLKVHETLNAALFPDAPTGSGSTSLALDDQDKKLYVANADNNCLAVFDVSEVGESRAFGFIPTGWYPSVVRFFGQKIYVCNGKGVMGSKANPQGPQPNDDHGGGEQYIAGLFKGALSTIDLPNPTTWAAYRRLVYENIPYSKDKETLAVGEAGNPIPRRVGEASPIKYVFYILKENRTYDQVFGDLLKGNGDPSLCLFPDSITPNHHALAREFVQLDNFYVDAEVSADGHSWSMAAYANDYNEKTWPTNYGGRGGDYDYEGQNPIAVPKAGFLWNHALKSGISIRNYGEFAYGYDEPLDPSLRPHTCKSYPAWDLNLKDSLRYERWKSDFDDLLRKNTVPRLSIFSLGGDHTSGSAPGARTPKAMVADNDWAMGKIVEHISKSPIWKETAIFIIEDDAQNGPDHVDAHRSVCLVASPYARRNHLEHTLYSTSSVVRTIELILGLKPMSQYDAAATSLFACFSAKANLKPYQALPWQINLNQFNPKSGKLAELSKNLPLHKVDAVPERLFNEIIWMAVKGPQQNMPAPRRSAFVFGESD
jgi:DNA-binding beta-propeller fold protein YncE